MQLSFVDRLHERGWVDRWAFLTFAFGGIILIPAAKAGGIDGTIIAAVALMVMVMFAAIQDRSGTGRVRSDQAGDNCYYLGLIYTLASLAYTIFTFNPGDDSSVIVQGFGIALATTIVGLVLRVFFNQSRTDLVEVEDTTRIELADAAGRLKAELNQISVGMNDFGRQIRQSITETAESSVEQISKASAAAVNAITEVAATASEALRAHETELGSSLRKMKSVSDKVVAAMEAQSESIASLKEAADKLVDGATAVRGLANDTQSALASTAAQISSLTEIQSNMGQSASVLSQGTGQIANSVGLLATALSEMKQKTDERLDELRTAPVRGVDEAVATLKTTVAHIGGELDKLLESYRATADGIAKIAGGARETVERHNEALEAELQRSRDNTAKVHTALVEMTSELVRKLDK